MLSTRDPPQSKGHIQTEREGLEKNVSRKQRQKAGVTIVISDKIDFKIKAVTGHGSNLDAHQQMNG